MFSRRNSGWMLIAIATITIAATLFATRQRFVYSFDSYFPRGDDRLSYYMAFRDTFGSDNEYLLTGVENERGIFQENFLRKIQQLTDTLTALPHILSVRSPATAINPIVAMGVIEEPVLHIGQPERYAQDSAFIYQSPEWYGTLFSQDRKSLLLILETERGMKKETSDSLLHHVTSVLESFSFDRYALAGKIRLEHEFVGRLLYETITTFGLSFILVVIVLLFTFRSVWGVIIPVLAVMTTVIWTLAVMELAGKKMSLVDTMLPSFLFIVGTSNSVHLLAKYIEELRSGKTVADALKTSMKEILWATFLTSFTTAIGFFTLTFTNVQPIREFGFYTAAGVMIAWILTIAIVPPLLFLVRPKVFSSVQMDSAFWRDKLRGVFLTILRRRTAILIIFGILSVAGAAGIWSIRVNRYYLDDLSPDDPLRKDHQFFAERFGGIKPFDMGITPRADSATVFSKPIVLACEKLDSFLTHRMRHSLVVGPNSLVKGAWKALNGGSPEYFKLPETDRDWKRVQKLLRSQLPKGNLKAIAGLSGRMGRITAKGKDDGSYHSAGRELALDSFYHAALDTSLFTYRITGSAKLVDDQNQIMSMTLVRGMWLGFFLFACIAGYMFRSLVVIVVAFIPNFFPLLVLTGIMGFAGIDLKFSTAMVFTIVFGIAVDDTIHILSKLRLELKKGRTLLYAMKRSYLTTGKAAIMTSVILMGGYLTPLASSFESIFYTGILVSAALFSALVADLYLLPVLLLAFYRQKPKKNQ